MLAVILYLLGLEVLTTYTFFPLGDRSTLPGKPRWRWLLLWMAYTAYGAAFLFHHGGEGWLLQHGLLFSPIRGNPFH